MKTLSVKNLKKRTRTRYHYKGLQSQFVDTTTSGGTDPTNTTLTILTTTHIM